MAFFDNLGAKLTQTGQKTMRKANDLADITRLNLRASELNRGIQELYTQLGGQYYALHGGAPEEALSELCQKIDGINRELERIRAEINAIKQVKVCPACGGENPIDARFCCKCSAALPEPEPGPEPQPEGRCCPQCGAPAPEDTQFCTNCGMRLPPPPEAPRPAGTPEDGGPGAP